MDINAIILSAGKGTRMQSELPKVVQKVCNYEMVNMVLKSLNEANIRNNLLVVGYKKDEVIKRIDEKYDFDFVFQEKQLGTGHAVLIAKNKLENKDGLTLITCGDTPLISSKTFENLVQRHQKYKNDLTILTTEIEDPKGYGRIIRSELDLVTSIVEEKDASENQKLISEINTGIYCFDNKKLFELIGEIKNENNQSEYYLTDLIEIFNKNDLKVGAYKTSRYQETLGVNDLKALSQASNILKKRINYEHMEKGVNIVDPFNTYIDPRVVIGAGTIIEPGVIIKGNSVIGTNCNLYSNSYIDSSYISNSCEIGPMAHLRNQSNILENCRVGNFVEIKNSKLGDSTKAGHLTYIGDAIVGDRVNFGCGTITANYDGLNKFKSVIGDDVFIGSNTNLIAPISISDKVFIGAGSTVTKDVDSNNFVVSRSELKIKPRR